MNKIILALDTSNLNDAINIAKKVKDKIFTIKLGLEFFNSHGKDGIKKCFRDKIHKYLQMFAGKFGIEPIFISWDIVIFVIFASVEILLISVVFLLPRENKISFYAHRMRFDKKFTKNTIYQAKTGFQFLQLEYDFTKKATKCYKKTTENCDFTQNKNQFLPDIWYFFEFFVKSHSMGIKWNFVFAGYSVHRRNKQNFNWSKNYKNRDISWNKNRFDPKLSSKHL